MKSHIITMFAVAVAAAAQAATVDQVIVRQQWPWSETVKVEYVLSDVTAPVNVSVTATADGTPVSADSLAAALSGDVFGVAKSGAHTIEIDPTTALGASRTTVRQFNVALSLSPAPAILTQELYRIFDLDDGSCESVSRADIMNHPEKFGAYETDFAKIGKDSKGNSFNTTLDPSEVFIWTGVTNNPIYKTDKLVMRHIYAKDKVWQGSVDNGNLSETYDKYWVKLTNDYLIAVFETTQAQWTKIYGTNFSHFASAEDSPYRPAENMFQIEVIGGRQEYYAIHGHTYRYMTVVGNELFGFPTNSYPCDVSRNTFLAKLWTKTGYEFFLPTDAQWEYACRAGTTTDCNHGIPGNILGTSGLVAWNDWNSDKRTHEVGTKPCNAFGLYDMLGNVAEMLPASGSIASNRNGHGESADDPIIEPRGTFYSFSCMKRGGAYLQPTGTPYWWTSSFSRFSAYGFGDPTNFIGFRVVCPVNRQWEAH